MKKFPLKTTLSDSRTPIKIRRKIFSIVYFKLKDRDNGKMKLVIDTDAGGDDAVAILLALAALPEDMQVIAVTCVYGNTDLDNVEKNVLKILTVAERSDVSSFKLTL